MSSILRTSNNLFIRVSRSKFQFLSNRLLARYNNVSTLYNVNNRLQFMHAGRPKYLQTSCSLFTETKEAAIDSRISRIQVTKKPSLSSELDDHIQKLDYDVRRTGRLNQDEVMKIFQSLKNIGSVSSYQGLMIIRCCGSFIHELQGPQRTALVNNIWEMISDMNCPLDISHYNALLKVYLENEHKFDPIEFLKIMEQKNIEPNRVTYQRLVSRYCEDGDIEGASKILEFMKSKELPVNENIFNMLITGHSRANNIEDAKKIFDVMRNAQLTPSSSTYCALACGYALSGDIAKVQETILEANATDNQLLDKDILNIVYTLTVNGHEQLVEQVLPHLHHGVGYNNDCINIILDLVNKGYHNMGFTLVKTMTPPVLADGSVAPSGFFFIKHIVKQDLPCDVVINYCNEMKEAGFNEDGLLQATKVANQDCKPEKAVTFLKELHSQKYIIRPHFFWPVLVRQTTTEDMYNTLKLMVDLECEADYDTFIDYVFPHVSSTDPHTLVSKLMEIGYKAEDIVTSYCIYALLTGDPKSVTKLVEKYPIKVSNRQSPDLLASSYLKSQDTQSIIQILQYSQENLIESSQTTKEALPSQFLVHLISTPSCTYSMLESVIKEMEKKNMKISNSAAQTVLKWFNAADQSSDQIANVLKNMVFIERAEEVTQSLLETIVDNLEAELASRKEKGLQIQDVLHRLLKMHAKQRHLDRVKEIIKELDDSGFTYPETTYGALLQIFIYHSELDQALQYKKLIDEKYPDFKVHDYDIFYLASLMTANKRYTEAEDLIRSHQSKFGLCDDPKYTRKSVFRLLDSFANSDDVEHARKIFELLHDWGYCKAENVLLGNLIKPYLQRNDIHGAVKEYLRIVSIYGTTPWEGEILKQLILLEDSETLQKVIDSSVKIHGEANVLFSLVTSFIDCGRIKQAQKVIETPGLRVRPERIEHICKSYVEKNMIKELESFIQITRDVFGLNRDNMYYHLLRAYASAENVDKALGVWVTMQEEDVQLSNRTLHFLGTFLQRMKQPVPFNIPTYHDDDHDATKPSKNIQRVLESKDVDSALTAIQSLKLSDGSLAIGDCIAIISSLLKNNRLQDALNLVDEVFASGYHLNLRVSRQLSIKLAEAGDKNKLLQLQKRLPEEIASIINFHDYLPVSMIRGGQEEEFLRDLEADVSKYERNFPAGGLLCLLQNKPETLNRVKELVDLYYGQGMVVPRNILWIHLMSTKCFEDAKTLFEATPEFQEKILFRRLIEEIRRESDTEISQNFLDLIKNTRLSSRSKGSVYSTHIEALITKMKLDEALDSLNESQSTIGLNNLNIATLVRLQEHLTRANKKVPLAISQGILELQKHVSQQDSSSSSSDSSDDEKH